MLKQGVYGLLLIIFGLCNSVYGQTDTLDLQIDQTSDLNPIRFDKTQLDKFKNSDEFDYSRDEDATNWFQAFLNWLDYTIKSFLESIFGNLKAGSWLFILVEILKYAIIAGIIVFIVWLFLRLNPGKTFTKSKPTSEVILSEEERIIREKDISELIKNAISQKNYRLAVRYYYLLILKELRDKDLIEYQGEKTNQEYRDEIENLTLSQQFSRITRFYEFIWYGDFPVEQQRFKKVEEEFKVMCQKLKTEDHA